MHLGLPHEGASADVFAAAMVSFCMVTGHMPFSKAVEEDPLYNLLFKGNAKDFWKSHEKLLATENTKISISSTFQDLMNQMLDPNPKKRPDIKAIKKHAWYNGPTLTKSEIISTIKGMNKITV